MKRKLRKLSMLTLAAATLGFSSVAYANESQEDEVLANVSGGGGVAIVHAPQEIKNFDNPVDRMYYSVFGEGFEYMQERSKEVNEVVYYNGIRMEVLSTITVRRDLSDTRELSEDVLRETIGDSYTFFTLQDTTGDRISSDMFINVTSNDYTWPHGYLIDFDEDTKTGTFIARHSTWDTYENDNTYQQLRLIVDRLIKDRVDIDEPLKEIIIKDLIDTHNPTFVKDEGREVLKKDELKIPIEGWEFAYISNIALRGNMLHIQTNTHKDFSGTNWNWHSINQLVNINTGDIIIDNDVFWLNNHDDEGNLINDREYKEIIFYIEDIKNLSSYYIKLIATYYETYKDINLNIDFKSPILKDNLTVEEDVKILIDNQEVFISNIRISPLEIRFSIDTGEELYGSHIDFSIMDNLNLTLIFEDGTRRENVQKRWGHNSWGMSWSWNESLDGTDKVFSNLEMILSNIVINTEDLVAISINDVIIQVK